MKWIFTHCFIKVGTRSVPCYKPGQPDEKRLFDLKSVKLEWYEPKFSHLNKYLTGENLEGDSFDTDDDFYFK